MATKSFGKEQITPRNPAQDLTTELYELVGVEFPLSIQVNESGKLSHASYETQWKMGGTEPIEIIDKKTREVTIENKETYETKKLSSDQIKKIDGWIKDRLAE